MAGSYRDFILINLLGNKGNTVFSVIYIPSKLAVFLIYFLTWSYNVCYEELLYYCVFSCHIHQSRQNNYEKALICGQEHKYINCGFMSRVSLKACQILDKSNHLTF